MSFSEIRWLWALGALPVLLLLELLARRRARRGLERLVGPRPDSVLRAQVVPGSRRVGTWLRLAALACLIVGAAGPEWGREVVRRSARGSDVVLVVDVSASMDARDVAPSRLDEARREALAVVDRLEGSRVGVVAFAGDAARLCPLTLDRSAARLTLTSLSSGSISTPGTDLGKALRMAIEGIPPGRREEQAIVLWTDGEDLERGARAALRQVVATGVRVFAVGVGTPAGGEVPVLDDEGRAVDVLRAPEGGPVRSRLDDGLLRTIARRTHGGYFSAAHPGGELQRLLASLGSLSRSARGTRLSERPIVRFRLFAILAIGFLALDLLRPRRRRQAESEAGAPLHSERSIVAAVLVVASCLPGTAQAQSDWARGDRAFRAARWVEAESLYARRLARGASDEVRANLAAARALSGRDPVRAGIELEALARRESRAGRAAGYNYGTWLGGRGELDTALAVLRAALRRDPGDEDARWNYEVLLRRRSERERQKPQPRPQQPRPAPAAPQSGRPQSSPTPTPQSEPRSRTGMTRAQAERLLSELAGMEQRDREQQRRNRMVDVKRERNW